MRYVENTVVLSFVSSVFITIFMKFVVSDDPTSVCARAVGFVVSEAYWFFISFLINLFLNSSQYILNALHTPDNVLVIFFIVQYHGYYLDGTLFMLAVTLLSMADGPFNACFKMQDRLAICLVEILAIEVGIIIFSVILKLDTKNSVKLFLKRFLLTAVNVGMIAIIDVKNLDPIYFYYFMTAKSMIYRSIFESCSLI